MLNLKPQNNVLVLKRNISYKSPESSGTLQKGSVVEICQSTETKHLVKIDNVYIWKTKEEVSLMTKGTL